MFRERMFHRTLDLMLDRLVAPRREVRDAHRITAAGAGQPRCVQKRGELFAVQRRRHHHQPQVFAQARLHIQRQRQAEIASEMPFVEFVEQDRPHAFQHRVVLQHPGEDAFGHHFDPRVRGDPVLEADAVTDGLAHGLAQLLRHELRCRARGHAAGFQHHDPAAGQPFGVQQRQRHLGGLAGTGRRFQHQARAGAQRPPDLRKQFGDGKGVMRGHRIRLTAMARGEADPSRGRRSSARARRPGFSVAVVTTPG